MAATKLGGPQGPQAVDPKAVDQKAGEHWAVVHWSPEDVAKITGGKVLRGAGLVRGVSINSRTLSPGELFVAYEGPRVDGHNYLEAARRAGAAGLLVTKVPEGGFPEDCFVVQCEDSARAFLQLSRAYREALPACTVIGITGTCGKTSIKDFAKHLLQPHHMLVAAERSFNNRFGLPLTIFRADERCEVLLCELGTNHSGELAKLAAVCQPDIGLISMIGRGHLEGFGDLQGVFEEKASLLEHVKPHGLVVLNADDPFYAQLVERAGARRILSYGVTHAADLQAVALRPRAEGVHFELVDRRPGNEGKVSVHLPLYGLHNVRNILAALSLAAALGEDPKTLCGEASTIRPSPRRLEVKPGPRGATILDDSYNANPESLMAALAVLDSWSGARKKIMVLADMGELGEDSLSLHQELGKQLRGRVDQLLTLGPLAAASAETFSEEAPRPGMAQAFLTSEPLLQALRESVGEGDLVLFKGSRMMELDVLVDQLLLEAQKEQVKNN